MRAAQYRAQAREKLDEAGWLQYQATRRLALEYHEYDRSKLYDDKEMQAVAWLEVAIDALHLAVRTDPEFRPYLLARLLDVMKRL